MQRITSNPIISIAHVVALAWLIVQSTSPPAVADGPSSAASAALFDRLDTDGDGQLVASEVAEEHERLLARLIRRADKNGDDALTRKEFLAGLVPSRPEKPLETKQPGELPQANAVRYLLLSMDTDGNNTIVAEEVPEDFRWAFDAMLERIDKNGNKSLERIELSRSGPQLARVAARCTLREGINVAAELRKLERKLGPSANRFDAEPLPGDYLSNPQGARQLFRRLDRNEDGQLTPKELPEQLQGRLNPIFRRGDRDRDGQISEREFIAAAERLADRMKRHDAMEMGRAKELNASSQ